VRETASYRRREDSRCKCTSKYRAETRSFDYRSNRSPSALTRDHSGRGAIRRITPMRRLSLFLRYSLSARRPSCSPSLLPATSLSCLFLFLSRLFALTDCVPTFLRSLFVSLFLSPFASTSAQSRVWVCAVVPRCFSPTTRLPLSPHWGHRVARYRSAISQIPASPRDVPISAMAVRPEVV
jgi:hypothetical protein